MPRFDLAFDTEVGFLAGVTLFYVDSFISNFIKFDGTFLTGDFDVCFFASTGDCFFTSVFVSCFLSKFIEIDGAFVAGDFDIYFFGSADVVFTSVFDSYFLSNFITLDVVVCCLFTGAGDFDLSDGANLSTDEETDFFVSFFLAKFRPIFYASFGFAASFF